MVEIELEVGDRVTINNKSKYLYDGTIGFCANTITKIERIGENGWYTTFEKIDENMQVGDYCRTNNGLIGKYYINKNSFNVLRTNEKEIGIDIEKDIVKHSKDITELIEKDDYVNGCRVYEVEEKGITVYQKVEDSATDFNWIAKDEVETIWTKEQLKYIEYNIN